MRQLLLTAALLCLAVPHPACAESAMKPSPEERTCFQTYDGYDPRIDLRSDVAIVYGVDDSLPARIQGWREHDYTIHVMSGVAWGTYQDYLYGKVDGRQHLDEAQVNRAGHKISHGGDVYYMVPTESFAEMLKGRLRTVVDLGAEAIHLEEPEFWVAGGYSEAFKREWQAYYHEPWIAPHSSPEAQYKASKLKYYLYRRCLDSVFTYAKQYAAAKGRAFRCYVPTHSMINYMQWGIVSPEASLAQIASCDGYIGQVWTGTARSPNRYRGKVRERTFETAFLEYGSLHSLVSATGKRMWMLHDPVEDNPEHDWEDYRTNYECTLVASLLVPDLWRYEVSPWPGRVFWGTYPKKGKPEEQEGIPGPYATELLITMNALNDMKQPRVKWDAGTPGVGVLVADTMMFQRGEPTPTDPNNFFGLAMPLVKAGIPVQAVQMEHMPRPGCLKPFRLIVGSYDYLKPPSAESEAALVSWVRGGGVLVFLSGGDDPYRNVPDWWSESGLTAEQHLMQALGLEHRGSGMYKVGKGVVSFVSRSPAGISTDPAGPEFLLQQCRVAWGQAGHYGWRQQNYLALRRGKYLAAACLDETGDDRPLLLEGSFVDLLDPGLPVVKQKLIRPGQRALLVDLGQQDKAPSLVAAAARCYQPRSGPHAYSCTLAGPQGVQCAARLLLPTKPTSVTADSGGRPVDIAQQWDAASNTLLVTFANRPSGVRLRVGW